MYIAIEWTSAAFRAFLMDGEAVAGEKKSDRGTTKVQDGAFEAALREELGDWTEQAEKILLSGMITSRNGWIESPFAPTPAGPADIAARAVAHAVAGLPALIFLPGIAQSDPLPDVMRGEEISLLGLGGGEGLFVLPGPHAKWVTVREGRISGITTYMSGEILNLLQRDSLVSRLIPQTSAESPEGFRRGVLAAYDDDLPGRILARIFSARSLVLFDRLQAEEISDYLAGLMIGAEIVEATGDMESEQITVVGSTKTAERYRVALKLHGLACSAAEPKHHIGFAQVARALEHQ